MAQAPDEFPTPAPTQASTQAPTESRRESTKPCPICGRPSIAAAAPFCSKRCGDVDLHRWLGGVYVVPAKAPLDAGDEDEA